ncbi:EAL domain-containing protein [Aquibacillus koreensis]|uniref:EAL domain-containing protein n=1 Tax=Aquibacillus koreensis TaxID=279446 RepID=A0A9X4AJW3_9BACI|nr:EAL domain-containing protein [Aquibacillus koreensis]MCT2537879.1 EAL domain-containing protein [Aquibacillus koreensis]MDC3422647.1 EAL domain-containing protein [Aquibacillus koreensis]
MNSIVNATTNLSFLWHYAKFVKRQSQDRTLGFARFIEFNKIIKNNLLSTYFQPILDLQKNKIIGYEGLNRPPQSPYFPNTESFYDYIGETNQAFFFEKHCRNTTLHEYYHQINGQRFYQDKIIFINIHPQVLVDFEYKSGETLQVLKQLNISPSQVVLELTEKKAVKDYGMFAKMLENYRSQGFRIAVDDAGSGYNSLKSVVQLKPEFIKLDKSLIQCIHQCLDKQKMVALLLDFALQSNTSVIAEGIEQQEELNYLKELGVHYGQGYLLGKPNQKLLV